MKYDPITAITFGALGLVFLLVILITVEATQNTVQDGIQDTVQEDLNEDGVVDLADFSIAVDQLGKIMEELSGEVPCDDVCEYKPSYEPEFSSVPLPYHE